VQQLAARIPQFSGSSSAMCVNESWVRTSLAARQFDLRPENVGQLTIRNCQFDSPPQGIHLHAFNTVDV
jgi:type II secretory pathway component PulM